MPRGQASTFASVLISYPVACFVMVKIVEYFSGIAAPSWAYLVAILVGHVFSLIYIVRESMKS